MMEYYRTGVFKDASNQRRKFIVCGIVKKQPDNLILATEHVCKFLMGKESTAYVPVKEVNGDGHIRAGLFLGISVCSPLDEFDEQKGREIAKSHALNGNLAQKWLHTDFPEIFTEEVLAAVVESYWRLVQENPQVFAPGYHINSMAQREGSDLDYDKLTNVEKKLVDALVDLKGVVNLPGLVNLALSRAEAQDRKAKS